MLWTADSYYYKSERLQTSVMRYWFLSLKLKKKKKDGYIKKL